MKNILFGACLHSIYKDLNYYGIDVIIVSCLYIQKTFNTEALFLLKNKKLLSLLYIIFTVGVVVVIGFMDRNNIGNLRLAISSVNMNWLMAAFASMIVFWLTDTFVLSYATGYVQKKHSYISMLKVAMIGQYYSALTPFATGGQPVQVYYLKKIGVSASKSTTVLVFKFIAWQMVVVCFSICSLIINYNFMAAEMPQMLVFTFIGLTINIGVIFVVAMVMINKDLLIRISSFVISKLGKVRLIKDPEKSFVSAKAYFTDINESITVMYEHKLKALNILIVSMVQFLSLMAVTYFIYRSLGLNDRSLTQLIMLQAILYMTVSFTPIPGASLASEASFSIFFGPAFPVGFLFVSLLLWRAITYYSNIIIGVFIVLWIA